MAASQFTHGENKMTKHIKMYYTTTCPFCRKAQELFTKLGVDEIDKVDVERDEESRDEMCRLTGRTSVPQIFIGSKHVGGCDDLYEAYNNGDLEKLLKENN